MAATFAVGDRVRIRDWDDMVAEFGVDEDGDIPCAYMFTEGMQGFCGAEYIISAVFNHSNGVQELFFLDTCGDENGYIFTADMCEQVKLCPDVSISNIEAFI